ncbi:MAG: cupredoxin family copper-binding protein [Acetobacteraceae bacterium]|nr:cupredoxin family copper-binding protein [Pseudomonadota bacterium]
MMFPKFLVEAGQRTLLVTALKTTLAAGALLLSCPSILWSSGEKQVAIDNFAFSPKTLTVEPGTRVTWTNEDDIPHTIVLTDGSIRSKTLDSEDTFSYRFDKAGTYQYICGLHPHMRGEVVVR